MWKKPAILAVFLVGIILLLAGCKGNTLTYQVTVSGQADAAGVVYLLDYSINVYTDVSANPCGDCADQPVHLYVGATAEEIAQALAEVVERADDLWIVSSIEGTTVTFRERTAGSVSSITAPSAPGSITLATTTGGRSVSILSNATAEVTAVDLPQDPQRLAAVYGPSYELLVVLGAEDKIVVRADVQTDSFPWAEVVFARIAQVPQLNNVHTSVSFEELMSYEPDLVFTFPRQNELNQLYAAGVAAIPGESGESLEDVKTLVRTYAAALGEQAQERAEVYCAYFDEKLAWVKERTDTLTQEERPSVYYAGVDVLTTYGKYSDLIEVIEAAGGVAVTAELEAGNRVQIDYEQLMAWDPDYIFFDHGGMNEGAEVEELLEEISTNVLYSRLTAVQQGNIALSPSGVFYWDMGLQKILLVMYMAQILHPQLFADLDMAAEVQEFYRTFYDYDLNYEDALRILNRLSPGEAL